MNDPHAAWLERIAAGDEQAMQRFYQAWAGPVYQFALRRLDEPADAADLLHEVMLDVWRQAGRFEERSRVRTWLFGIAHHKVLDRLRRLGRSREREAAGVEAGAQPDTRSDTLAAAAAASHAGWVRHCLETLAAIHRQVLHLAFFEDLSCSEIAEVLGCPPGTVKTRLMHGRKNMKRCLERLGVDA
ncbi:MAG TPA: sigma-70 family RNA polymerase sigma factor [Gammaproteobacteria bacterium]|nr:sigma-70 family RNA polymerase sigma factor [Gammaproteobacteria bacterium]